MAHTLISSAADLRDAANRTVERDRARASIGNPARALAVHGAGSFSGQGRTAAEALRGARAEADLLGDGSRIGVAA